MTNQLCPTCHYSCLTCTGVSTQCLTCVTTRTIDIVNKKCPCNTLLFDSNVSTCSSCKYNCQDCVNAI